MSGAQYRQVVTSPPAVAVFRMRSTIFGAKNWWYLSRGVARTDDAAARDAIHELLGLQIEEHRTLDSEEGRRTERRRY